MDDELSDEELSDALDWRPYDPRTPDALALLLPKGWSLTVNGDDYTPWSWEVTASRIEGGVVLEQVVGTGDEYAYARDEVAVHFSRPLIGEWLRAGNSGWTLEAGCDAAGTSSDPFVARHATSSRLWLVSCDRLSLALSGRTDIGDMRHLWDDDLLRRHRGDIVRWIGGGPWALHWLPRLLEWGEEFGQDVRIRDFELEEMQQDLWERTTEQLRPLDLSGVPPRYVHIDVGIYGPARRFLGQAPPLPWPDWFWLAVESVASEIYVDQFDPTELVIDDDLDQRAFSAAEELIFQDRWDPERWKAVLRTDRSRE